MTQQSGERIRAFPAEVLAEARGLQLTPKIFVGRREVKGLTLDGPFARELDDAIWVEALKPGFRVTVSIADVAAVVPKNCLVDQEAQTRGSTHYLGKQSMFPMLPLSIVNNCLSLEEARSRPTISYEIELDSSLNITGINIGLTRLASEWRLDYRYADNVLSYGRNDTEWDFFVAAYTVASGLHTQRRNRGGLAFFDMTQKLVSTEEGAIHPVASSEANKGNLIVQEFMILANEATARFLLAHGYPALFRNHTARNPDAEVEGFTMPKNFTLEAALSMYNRKLEAHLNPAVYSPNNEGHIGLRSGAYSHATSPIRRYPDVVAQRVIHAILAGEEPPYNEGDLRLLSDHLNQLLRERKVETEEWLKLRAISVGKRAIALNREAYFVNLDKGEFYYALKEVADQEKLTPEIGRAIRSRIKSGEINTEQAVFILEAMPIGDDEAIGIQQLLLAYMVNNLSLVQSMTTFISSRYGWSKPRYSSMVEHLGEQEIWGSTAVVIKDDEEVKSDLTGGSSRSEAQHNARISLLANMFGIENQQVVPKLDIEAIHRQQQEQEIAREAVAQAEKAKRREVQSVIREGLLATKDLGLSKLNGVCYPYMPYQVEIIDENPLGKITAFTARATVKLPSGEEVVFEGRGADKKGAMNSAALKASQELKRRKK